MINQGVPVTLNSDDPSVFGSIGLSHDFFQVFVSSETMGLMTLKQIALDSIEVRHRRSAQVKSVQINDLRFSFQRWKKKRS